MTPKINDLFTYTDNRGTGTFRIESIDGRFIYAVNVNKEPANRRGGYTANLNLTDISLASGLSNGSIKWVKSIDEMLRDAAPHLRKAFTAADKMLEYVPDGVAISYSLGGDGMEIER